MAKGKLGNLDEKTRQKIAWEEIRPFLDIPSCQTQVGRRTQKSASRKVESKMHDPIFVFEYEEQRQSFKNFLLKHDLAPYPPLQEFLNKDIRSFLEPKTKTPTTTITSAKHKRANKKI